VDEASLPDYLDLPIDAAQWELAQARRVGFCERPVLLVGRDASGAPCRLVAVRCKARQAAKCVPCSVAFQLDARRLIRLGFAEERKSLRNVRWWWLTVTAPGIELTGSPVHAVRKRPGNSVYLPCFPRPCFACGKPISCGSRHEPGHRQLGAPFAGHEDCFRYWAVVRWNANVPRLWDRTMSGIRASLIGRPWTLQAAKVVQWQARGCVHVHAVIRTTATSSEVRNAIAGARVQGWGWGSQLTLERLSPAGAETTPEAARAIASRIDYLCRYATRDVRILIPRTPGTETDLHLHRLREQGRALAVERGAANPERIAAGLGYGGQILTHSRKWGSSFAQLAAERQAFMAGQGGAQPEECEEPMVWSVAQFGWQSGSPAQRLTREMFAQEKPLGFSQSGDLPPFLQAVPGEGNLSWWEQRDC
jgi:hypothetical protein